VPNRILSTLLAIATTILVAGCAPQVKTIKGGGIDVGQRSSLADLVPAGKFERASSLQYGQMLSSASKKKVLASKRDPQLKRLRRIAARIIPFTTRINPRAKDWKWEVNLLKSKQINAFCMPGGKIAFYSGLINKLKLTDNEIAVVMGHEIAHALREHARAQTAKSSLTQTGAAIGTSILDAMTGGKYGSLIHLGTNIGGQLLTLKFSRNDESEADLVGLDLAARAGYDPRAGVSLWRKMMASSKGAPLLWLSTHPAGNDRIARIKKYLPAVMPLYTRARRAR